MVYGKAGSDNPNFIYPNKNIRFLDAQRGLDRSRGGDKPLTYSQRSFQIQRGYIRNLQPAAVLKDFRSKRCNFQFNPQEIRQNVQMREDIYNPVLLTAEQLSQPIGGNVSFQFDLFFDRSHELSGNTKGPVSAGITEYMYDPSNKGPEQIGVYADLRVLYSIIGQGLSQETIDLQLEMLRSTYNAKVAREAAYSESTATDATNSTTTTGSATEVTTDAFDQDFTDKEGLRRLLEDNKGNAAFLLPNPVRIVFSPLLMVDGFVTSTSVDFLKFNNDMVPMQCRVAMGVNALYIGFAKERTYLTTTIETGRNALIEEQRTDTAAVAPVETALTSSATMKPFRMGFGAITPEGASSTKWPKSWDLAIRNGDITLCSLYYYLMPNSVINSFSGSLQVKRVGYAGFPNIKPVAGSGKDIDPILQLFEDPNIKFTIGYEWGFTIYGRANQNSFNGVGWTSSQANAVLSNRSYRNAQVASVVGSYSGSARATEKSEWGSGASGSTRDGIRRKFYSGNDTLANTGSYDLQFTNDTIDNIKESYYIVSYTFKLFAEAGSVYREYTSGNSNNYIAVVRGTEGTGVFNGSPSNVTTVDTYVS